MIIPYFWSNKCSQQKILLIKMLSKCHYIIVFPSLSQCGLTMACCDSLAATLEEKSSSLRELSLGVNNLQDLGIQILCADWKSTLSAGHFRVMLYLQLSKLLSEKFYLYCMSLMLFLSRLSNCGVTGEGCTILSSALRSKSLLRELDLSENNLTDSTVRPLSVLLDDPDCTLEKLM